MLYFQATSSLATSFVILQHAIAPEKDSPPEEPIYYTNGSQDFAAIFFYTLIAVVVHAILQEYVIDVSCSKHSIIILFSLNILTFLFILVSS